MNVKDTIEHSINPVLAQHGGACEFKGVCDGVLTIALTGGCAGCPRRKHTFFGSIRPFLLEHHPELKDVELANEPTQE